ncbi:hypothetical protein D9757_006440 [Collybiopsis confluens]|uniref:Uncharacterized protein n=1 Tax=Collybiopsis confluens TaxID=2823264 RepID=A0A8H5HJA1_9AGAR|nr:hypothetical protein D9757_006440 [Collybiopsis confluens]
MRFATISTYALIVVVGLLGSAGVRAAPTTEITSGGNVISSGSTQSPQINVVDPVGASSAATHQNKQLSDDIPSPVANGRGSRPNFHAEGGRLSPAPAGGNRGHGEYRLGEGSN